MRPRVYVLLRAVFEQQATAELRQLQLEWLSNGISVALEAWQLAANIRHGAVHPRYACPKSPVSSSSREWWLLAVVGPELLALTWTPAPAAADTDVDLTTPDPDEFPVELIEQVLTRLAHETERSGRAPCVGVFGPSGRRYKLWLPDLNPPRPPRRLPLRQWVGMGTLSIAAVLLVLSLRGLLFQYGAHTSQSMPKLPNAYWLETPVPLLAVRLQAVSASDADASSAPAPPRIHMAQLVEALNAELTPQALRLEYPSNEVGALGTLRVYHAPSRLTWHMKLAIQQSARPRGWTVAIQASVPDWTTGATRDFHHQTFTRAAEFVQKQIDAALPQAVESLRRQEKPWSSVHVYGTLCHIPAAPRDARSAPETSRDDASDRGGEESIQSAPSG